jgi:nucleotide-binding universal stress UspA family protein
MAKIVVGIDGSDASKDALRWALEEARLRGDDLVAVHAWQPPPPVPALALAPSPATDLVVLPELQESAEKLVTALVAEAVGDESGVQLEPVAIEGPAATVLIDAAGDAELLVVGSRGHGGFMSLMLGSVSHQVAQHAPCPVVIHRRRQ